MWRSSFPCGPLRRCDRAHRDPALHEGDTLPALALRAIRSTASSLAPGDRLYLRVDGGQLTDPEVFRSAAAPATLMLREVAERRAWPMASTSWWRRR